MSYPLERRTFTEVLGNVVEGEHRSSREQLFLEVLQQLHASIKLLDRANAPGHIAAHIDLAMHQLQDVIECEFAGMRMVQIERKAAPQ